ncbi:NAD-dependent epimerase/dehydratase [Rhodospirillaceae bacterium KN72]|uniref:NAD-dependent epimerase/dehydratase n=1 Tax=Pacificispira spongiicola TaxID=2729598 RepID=A0A7Y0E3U6_9PROT|nr:NAD-dependent epimerase/dehydratase family protein [Pacificispira spongiicola]NMM46714.1 NAD-dependent epimerase/dehydratase [Pacificispira spongiicola]
MTLTHDWPEGGRPNRVVVVGAAGFVGGAIFKKAQAAGLDVLPITRRDVDLLAEGAATRLAGLLRPDDALVAVSAIAPVKNAAMLKDNVALIDTLVEAVKSQPVAHLLNIGSDAIYSDSPDALTEESPKEPGQLHGIMHYLREVMLREAAGETPFATLRPTLIYGAGDPHNGYGPNRFRRLVAEGKSITLFGNGEERRDHVYVEDVADLALRILQHRSRGALNAATGAVISFREVAEAIVGLASSPVAIEGTPRSGPMPHNGYRPFDPAATRAAFQDFEYVQPLDGFARVAVETTETA